MTQAFTIWLEPAEHQQQQLSSLIHRLATEQNAIPFAPHITVYSGKTNDLAIIQQGVANIARQLVPIQLRIAAIKASDFFFKTVFLTFEQDDSVYALNQSVQQIPHENIGYHLYPHLSLLYKDMPLSEKQTIAQSIKLPMTDILFNRISVVIPGQAEDWQDIAAWKPMFTGILT